jgi:hypothetical protein
MTQLVTQQQRGTPLEQMTAALRCPAVAERCHISVRGEPLCTTPHIFGSCRYLCGHDTRSAAQSEIERLVVEWPEDAAAFDVVDGPCPHEPEREPRAPWSRPLQPGDAIRIELFPALDDLVDRKGYPIDVVEDPRNVLLVSTRYFDFVESVDWSKVGG